MCIASKPNGYGGTSTSSPFPASRGDPPLDFHFPEVHEAIAAAIPEREAIVFRDGRATLLAPSFAGMRDSVRGRQADLKALVEMLLDDTDTQAIE